MKYVDGDEKVQTLIAERHPFKGVKNYFTDSLFYEDSLEADENLHPEKPDSDSELMSSKIQKKNVFGS